MNREEFVNDIEDCVPYKILVSVMVIIFVSSVYVQHEHIHRQILRDDRVLYECDEIGVS